MPWRGYNPPEIRISIGCDVLLARRNGVPWKILERRHGYGRTRLSALMREAEQGLLRDNPDVHEQDDAGILNLS